LLMAAQAARRDDAYADAERLLSAAELAAEATAATRLEWVLLGLQQGEFAEEERVRALVAGNYGDAPVILEAFAKGFVAADRWEEAIEAYNMLLARNPDRVAGLIGRGTVLARMGPDRMELATQAERDFRRAVQLAPMSAGAHGALAAQ